MTQLMKNGLLAVLLGAILSAAPVARAGITVEMIAVGNETQFNAWALAAHAAAGTGAGNWTIQENINGSNSFYASMHDVRVAGIPLERGRLWVVWNQSMTQVWCYLKTDSGTATRGFLAVPRAQLLLNSVVTTTPGLNLVPGLPPDDTVGLPASIYTAINNMQWNAMMTANLPNVNWAENNKMLATPAAPPVRYGYGPVPFTYEIKATVSNNYRTPVVFNISGTDPITGLSIPAYQAVSMPASLVVPIVNATNTGSGGIGSFIATNHDVTEPCGTLSNGLKGLTNTTQLFGLTSPPGNLLTVFLDDPLDGPWWIVETEIYTGCSGTKSQEAGVNPVFANNDPLHLYNGSISLRERVLGQQGALATVTATPDSISYVSWTCNRFAGKSTYLTVNGEEPFSLPWTTTLGVFPACGTATVSLPWPLFTKQLVMTDNPVPPGVAALINPVKVIVTPGDVWP